MKFQTMRYTFDQLLTDLWNMRTYAEVTKSQPLIGMVEKAIAKVHKLIAIAKKESND